MNMKIRTAGAALALTALMVGLNGCAAPSEPSGSSVSSSTQTMASSVTITDSWFRAVDDVTGGMAMTGFFMLVTNNSDKDVTIVGGSVADDVSAEPLEAHEVVEDATGAMVMQEVSGGITIPAGGSVELMPGGYHIMLMSLLKPILAGEDLMITVDFADGSTADVTGLGYTIENGIEKYVPESSM